MKSTIVALESYGSRLGHGLFKSKKRKMKKLIVVVVLLVVGTSLSQAQEETLFGRSHSAGFFFSPMVEYSMLDSEVRASSGGGLGLVIDNFFIGGYGLAAVDVDALINDNAESLEVDIAHSGLWLGYVFPSHKLVHLYTSVRGGWGLVNTTFDNNGINNGDRIFVVTPEAGVEVNLFRWLRLAGTVGYRQVNGVNNSISGLTNSDVSGVTGGLTLRIGAFGRHHRHHHRKTRKERRSQIDD